MRHLDLFSGIGGFRLAVEAVWPDSECNCFVEKDPFCQKVLKKYWPNTPIHDDIRTYQHDGTNIDLATGGDPCPIRSRARSSGESNHPDMSGYFLSRVGIIKPGWVVRENVPAPDDVHFVTALELIGYGSVIIRTNSDTITGQCRQRDFIVGCYQKTPGQIRKMFPDFEDGPGAYTTRLGTRPITPALTTHRTRYDSRDCYIFDKKLRILDSEEREKLAGFPYGWTAGFSAATRARMLGNAIVPQVAVKIFQAIKEVDQC